MQIYWCRVCGKGHPNSGWEDEEEIAEREKCRTEHKIISVLEPVEGSFVSDKGALEVVKTTFFYAVDENGKQWVVKKWRTDINEPLAYEIFEGRIATWITEIKVQEDAIRQWAARGEIGDSIFVSFFVSFLRHQLPFVKFDREMVVDDNDSPKIQILLNQRMVVHLIAQAPLFLKEEQSVSFKKFVEEENVSGGVLPFLGRRNFRII